MDKASKITDALRLPAAIDAECQVVGSLVIDPTRIGDIAKLLRPASFVDPCHRKLALEFHPDKGGSHQEMKVVNRCADLLAELMEAPA